ncbi:MAG: YkgJ family cysteine cluster protein [Promethearchaeota archaeon]|jgi:Fe-S-cluster containining protein
MKNKCENCGVCCLRTEMILVESDIDRILKKSPYQLQISDFAFKNEEGLYQLKNIDDHCIFLDPPSLLCKIYNYRPRGCGFYPLIYDFQEENCKIDKDCPRPHLFYQDKTELKKVCQDLFRFLKKELFL